MHVPIIYCKSVAALLKPPNHTPCTHHPPPYTPNSTPHTWSQSGCGPLRAHLKMKYVFTLCQRLRARARLHLKMR